jgi:hypothetical protein
VGLVDALEHDGTCGADHILVGRRMSGDGFYDVIPRGFKEVEVECGKDDEFSPSGLPFVNRLATSDEDGHLEDDEYHRRHPDDA